MVSSSKILTVSYGTFSCTAEGFEDPLAVVKETTHFFRGVIREDRFFGAEPPQFDPEMAAQLLQSQLSSELGEGALTLRSPYGGGAASAGALSAALAAGPSVSRPAAAAPAPAPVPAVEDTEETPAEERAAAAELPAEDDAEAPVSDAIGVALAAAESADEATASDDDLEDTAAAVADLMAGDAAEALDLPDLSSDDDALADLDDAGGDDSLEAEAEFFETGSVPPVQAEAPATLTDPESVAAKLRRIRAVVAGGQAAATEALHEDEEADEAAAVSAMLGALTPEAGDETPAAAEAQRDNLFTDTLAGLDFDDAFDDDGFDEDEDAQTTAFFDEDDEDDDEGTAELDTPAPEAAVAAPEPAPVPAAGAPLRRPRARVVKVKRAVFEAAVADGLIDEASAAAAKGNGTVSSLSPEDEDDLARELAAVKAELKADFDEAWGEDEDDWDDAPAAETAAAPRADEVAEDAEDDWDLEDDWDDEDEIRPAAISDEDGYEEDEDEEAAAAVTAPLRLRKEDAAPTEAWDDDEDLAEALEDEFEEAFDADEEDDEPLSGERLAEEAEAVERLAREGARKAVKMSSPARAMLTEQSVEDYDASRILDETNTQLQEPEGNRRRSAIAHLRAAVAATRADKLLGRKKDSEEAFEPYREDLANVVRPRRPQAPSSHTERPSELVRPAPLKLVAEQRVDAEMPAPRPRRVRVADFEDETLGGADEVGSGFAAYAESVGASELPELLEAAAAYMSFVEGREQFSRPQLMTKVRQVELQESSREDRLRTFGQLLRDGKIEKTRGGRFTASERISFKPGARAAG
ncbi:hypothetical protein [Salipiger pentaromativorans]|uniref:hypothetical protein n=1 Tax=Salipiger pentaromativorans TaxID=2943193 RepID=UPI002158358A|nr:hypothetical protein [Salipiger pentaromativorans]